MKRIMLVCNAGMSTSMLVTKMQAAAEELGQEFDIYAVPVSEADRELETKEIDIVLLGPQVKFLLNDFKAKCEPKIKVDAINMMDYGVMNGKNVLTTAISMLNE